MSASLVGSEMCIRDSCRPGYSPRDVRRVSRQHAPKGGQRRRELANIAPVKVRMCRYAAPAPFPRNGA
eukprot:4663209-Alexandrium_andersonii.AAC.1